MAESEDAGYSASSKLSYRQRTFWLKHLHRWHWISAALCLAGLLLFAITGFTLNHAAWITSTPRVTTTTLELPLELLAAARSAAADSQDPAPPLPQDLARWLGDRLEVRLAHRQVEWSAQEIYVSLPRPGGDAWLTLDLDSGEVTHELTDRGWIAYWNDLHKGRNTGGQWSLFIDVFALATLVFAATGLILLKMHAGHRPGTWPLVGLGLVVPLLIALLFIH
ncbi:membrane protein [Steroidobacter denitrificans]|uniref:Membrane protein n=1 Tax=Steroidobacter denitrificans TaxID=465721 RepID=A0A127FAE6_STEDE|nr:PepSY-associated TM helix domain-containing protein [Steroidobacter denitrificans]AMN46570.1 membrane protein [Steroidobacter denitrificans]